MGLERLATEYRAAVAEADRMRKVYERSKQAVSEAGSALIQQIIAEGLTEYGPITSELRPSGPFNELRRFWKPKEEG